MARSGQGICHGNGEGNTRAGDAAFLTYRR
ncbi:hypothetical protein JOF35_007196 [Streptomyces demainii]|uniref:Uncharacterized protein n=1 Tax=Streptomyces demainii TaxID=588122 RepID=A0ABT9L2D6_9ACTN|nr:hypothetical protein [Streptomyces demainii]